MTYSGPAPLYDDIGGEYDTTRRADPYIANRLASHLNLSESGLFLDIACGTGNYTAALAAKGGRWHGVDVSLQMLLAARPKSEQVSLFLADAASLPFRDGVFAGVASTLAIHHFDSLLPVFLEVSRVIDRGTFAVFTATPEQMRGYWLNEYFPEAMARSIDQMPALDLVVQSLNESGFRAVRTERYDVQPGLRDFFLYSGKHRPDMYLSGRVRQGISTFASLADPAEVAEGCSRLREDIASGRIAGLMDKYRHNRGDYLFVISRKGI
jgi:ubiquinone/menaquinone biosynthesis C-methylase UbiE